MYRGGSLFGFCFARHPTHETYRKVGNRETFGHYSMSSVPGSKWDQVIMYVSWKLNFVLNPLEPEFVVRKH